jgi:hypothetical protein
VIAGEACVLGPNGVPDLPLVRRKQLLEELLSDVTKTAVM